MEKSNVAHKIFLPYSARQQLLKKMEARNVSITNAKQRWNFLKKQKWNSVAVEEEEEEEQGREKEGEEEKGTLSSIHYERKRRNREKRE